MSTKRSVWALIGKVLWLFLSLVLRVVAALGSKWARTKLDQRAEKRSGGRVKRVIHPRSRS